MPRPRKSITKKPPGAKHYQYDWTIEGHRFRGGTGEAKSQARADRIALKIYDKLLDEVKLGVVSTPKNTITLDEAFDRYTEEYAVRLVHNAGYVSRVRTLLRVIGKQTLLSDIDNETILHFIRDRRASVTKRKRPPKDATIRLEVHLLLGMLRRARKIWKVQVGEVDPETYRETLQRSRPIEMFLRDWGEVQAVMDHITPHYHPIIKLALFTGLRKSNVVLLQWEQVSMERQEATVTLKGGRKYTIDLIPAAIEMLEALEPVADRRTGPVFRFGNPNVDCECPKCVHLRRRPGVVHPIRFIGPVWQKARAKAGLPDLRWHDLRHTVASWLLSAGNSLKMAQEVLAHKNIATTTRYAHLERRQIRSGMEEALSPDRGLKVVPMRSRK